LEALQVELAQFSGENPLAVDPLQSIAPTSWIQAEGLGIQVGFHFLVLYGGKPYSIDVIDWATDITSCAQDQKMKAHPDIKSCALLL
jgi:hypothetical protein